MPTVVRRTSNFDEGAGINPLADIYEVCSERRARKASFLLHSDALFPYTSGRQPAFRLVDIQSFHSPGRMARCFFYGGIVRKRCHVRSDAWASSCSRGNYFRCIREIPRVLVEALFTIIVPKSSNMRYDSAWLCHGHDFRDAPPNMLASARRWYISLCVVL